MWNYSLVSVKKFLYDISIIITRGLNLIWTPDLGTCALLYGLSRSAGDPNTRLSITHEEGPGIQRFAKPTTHVWKVVVMQHGGGF